MVGGTGRMLSGGEGEAGWGGWREWGGRQGAAICQTMQTCPPPSNLRYTVYFLSPFRHSDKLKEGGNGVGQPFRPVSPTPVVQGI